MKDFSLGMSWISRYRKESDSSVGDPGKVGPESGVPGRRPRHFSRNKHSPIIPFGSNQPHHLLLCFSFIAPRADSSTTQSNVMSRGVQSFMTRASEVDHKLLNRCCQDFFPSQLLLEIKIINKESYKTRGNSYGISLYFIFLYILSLSLPSPTQQQAHAKTGH